MIITHDKMKEASKEVQELLYTLKEICRLCYLKEIDISSKTILRLYNLSFIHVTSCIGIFGKNPKLKSFYGIYSFSSHMAFINRIIVPSSLNIENEGRIFRTIKNIALTTSSRNRNLIRDNGIIRFQAEKKFYERNSKNN